MVATLPLRPLIAALLVSLLSTVVGRPAPAAAEARVTRAGQVVTAGNARLALRYNLQSGLADFVWNDRIIIRNGYAGASLGDGVSVFTFGGSNRTATDTRFTDAIGAGVELRVTTEIAEAGVRLHQTFLIYDDAEFLTARVSVERVSGEPIAVEQIEVVAASLASTPSGGVLLDAGWDPRFYQAPFYNNDDFITLPMGEARGALSYWLGGVFDANVGNGLLLGAVETDVWKSAVWFDGPSGSVSAHSGTRSPVDTVPVPPRSGARVDSALTFVGYRASYSDALADLMRAIRAIEPPLPVPAAPAPIGWSAWYEYGIKTDEATVRGVTDFIATNWKELGYRYINLDAGWNRADGDTRPDPAKFPGGMESLVSFIHERGLLAGAYFVPFAISPSLLDQPAPGSGYRYRDLILRDAAGVPVRPSILDWEYVLDITHPGAVPLLEANARRIAGYGFDFVKLDFLQIGTQEGARYDPSVSAMQAFNRGMAAITRVWTESGRPIYVSAAISPLYVQRYAHARRVGNDVEFGQARQAGNVALSWFTGLLYDRNDPDNAVVRGGWFPGYNTSLAKLHVTMAALGGTLFLAGDDPRALSPERAALLTNPRILALAREPLVIRPLSVRGSPPPVWSARATDGAQIVGIFNWNGSASVQHTITIADLGLDPRAAYRVEDLWEGQTTTAESTLTIDLPPHGVALLRLTRN